MNNNKLQSLLDLSNFLKKEWFYHDTRLYDLRLEIIKEQIQLGFFQKQMSLIDEEIKKQKRIELEEAIRQDNFEAQLRLGKNG